MLRTCMYCNGTGHDPLDGGQCDECNGTGLMECEPVFEHNVNLGYDRTWNNADGTTYYGYDDAEEGTTAWYDAKGGVQDITPIPDEFDQTLNDEGYF